MNEAREKHNYKNVWTSEKFYAKTGWEKLRYITEEAWKKVSLAKSKINNIEFLISKALIDSNISHDEFFFNK